VYAYLLTKSNKNYSKAATYALTSSASKSDFVWPRATCLWKYAAFTRLLATLLTPTLHVYRLRSVNRIYVMRVYSLYGMMFADILSVVLSEIVR